MLGKTEQPRDDSAQGRIFARRLSRGFFALVLATTALIVLGALVRAHEAGLACPDWPLCFGLLVPEMNLKVAFEWSHRALAGSVSLGFAGLSIAALRRAPTRAPIGRLLALAALLLGAQILLGALTVWKLLAAWTVTAHLITGNGFALVLLLTAVTLRERAGVPPHRPPVSPAARAWIGVAVGLLRSRSPWAVSCLRASPVFPARSGPPAMEASGSRPGEATWACICCTASTPTP